MVERECKHEGLPVVAQVPSLSLGEFPGDGQTEPRASSAVECDEALEGALFRAGRL